MRAYTLTEIEEMTKALNAMHPYIGIAWTSGSYGDNQQEYLSARREYDIWIDSKLRVLLAGSIQPVEIIAAANAHYARLDGTQAEHLTIDGAEPPANSAS